MLRPRTLGKIVVGFLALCCMLTALLYAIAVHENTQYYGARAVTYSLLALTLVTAYRYFED
jgi:hypothetical protein